MGIEVVVVVVVRGSEKEIYTKRTLHDLSLCVVSRSLSSRR
jgi:hypothetical protein